MGHPPAPGLHRVFATLWATDALWVSLDSCRFTPPWRPGYAEPQGLHWDHAPRAPGVRSLQGVLALTDTAVGQGGWRCVPSLYHEREAWPETPTIDADGDESWPADARGRAIVHVPAAAGDLIVWDSHLPHGNSMNGSDRPRLAFYVMLPAGEQQEALRQELVGVVAHGPLLSVVARPAVLRPGGALAARRAHAAGPAAARARAMAEAVAAARAPAPIAVDPGRPERECPPCASICSTSSCRPS